MESTCQMQYDFIVRHTHTHTIYGALLLLLLKVQRLRGVCWVTKCVWRSGQVLGITAVNCWEERVTDEGSLPSSVKWANEQKKNLASSSQEELSDAAFTVRCFPDSLLPLVQTGGHLISTHRGGKSGTGARLVWRCLLGSLFVSCRSSAQILTICVTVWVTFALLKSRVNNEWFRNAKLFNCCVQ